MGILTYRIISFLALFFFHTLHVCKHLFQLVINIDLRRSFFQLNSERVLDI